MANFYRIASSICIMISGFEYPYHTDGWKIMWGLAIYGQLAALYEKENK